MRVVIVVIQKDDRFAFMQRKDGSWTFPSGKIEWDESIEKAALRESREETGLDIDIIGPLGSREREGRALNYVHAKPKAGRLRVTEPDKFQKAGWKTVDEILELTGMDLYDGVLNLFETILNAQKTPKPHDKGPKPS